MLSLMEKEHKGETSKLSVRQRSREVAAIRKRSMSGNNAVRNHKREAEEQQRGKEQQ